MERELVTHSQGRDKDTNSPTKETLDLQLALPMRNAGTKMEQTLREWLTNDLPKLRSILQAGTNP